MRAAILTSVFTARCWSQASSGGLIGDVTVEHGATGLPRGEAFDSLNHPNIGIPGPYPDCGPFYGKALSASNPRRMQFALRYDF